MMAQAPPWSGLSRAVIDLGAIADNVRALRRVAAGAHVMAVVKADGYGHGMIPSAAAALRGGSTWLGVAHTTEALALRAASLRCLEGSPPRILTWLYPHDEPLARVVAHQIDLSVSHRLALEQVIAAARFTGQRAMVHLKVDTGLGRNGQMPDGWPDLVAAAALAERDGLITVVGIWSHLACADDVDHPATSAQAACFQEALTVAATAGLRPSLRHLANSAATLTRPDLHYDLVRTGVAIYGLSPGVALPQGLQPAMTIQARLVSAKTVPSGHGVSYGHHYVTSAPTRLGLVPLGYADGIPRHASSGNHSHAMGGPMRVGGRIVRVAGRVCMDQFVVDLGPESTEVAGDVVTLFGAEDGAVCSPPSADDWAMAADTINYEMVTRIGQRVPRIYCGEGTT